MCDIAHHRKNARCAAISSIAGNIFFYETEHLSFDRIAIVNARKNQKIDIDTILAFKQGLRLHLLVLF
jgi:hypothetical protein